MSVAPRVVAKKAFAERVRKMRHDYGFSDTKHAWKGPVERRDPRHYQQPSTVLSRCVNRWCALWLAATPARCPHCHERQG